MKGQAARAALVLILGGLLFGAVLLSSAPPADAQTATPTPPSPGAVVIHCIDTAHTNYNYTPCPADGYSMSWDYVDTEFHTYSNINAPAIRISHTYSSGVNIYWSVTYIYQSHNTNWSNAVISVKLEDGGSTTYGQTTCPYDGNDDVFCGTNASGVHWLDAGDDLLIKASSVYASSQQWFDFRVDLWISQPGTPTPSPTSSLYGTPFPGGAGTGLDCITPTPRGGITPTVQATNTPVVVGTARPTECHYCFTPMAPQSGTNTPTPTITSTPAPTAAIERYNSGAARFTDSLNPWAVLASAYTPTAQWSNTLGADNATNGVAKLPYIAQSSPVTLTDAPGGAIVFQRPGGVAFPLPLQVTGDFKSDPVPVGDWNYIVVYAFNGSQWIRYGEKRVGSTWGYQNFHIRPVTDTAPITAIAVKGLSLDFDTFLSPQAYTISGTVAGLYADNLSIVAGRDALQVCGALPGGGGGSGTTKVCTITVKYTAIVGCIKPTNFIDVPQWLAYWFCWLGKYFEFSADNQQQVFDLSERQRTNEPIGTMADMGQLFDVFGETLTSMEAASQNSPSFYAFDMSQMLDWRAIDSPLVLRPPDPNTNYISGCPAVIANISQTAQRSACYVVMILRQQNSIYLVMFNYMFVVWFLWIFVQYVRTTWFVTNN